MNDQEKAQRIEKANSYRQMMEQWAWKDFMKTIDDEKANTIENLLTIKGSSEDFEFAKGYIAAFKFIQKEIDFILSAI